MGKCKSLLKAVVAGATGLIGTHLVESVLEKGDKNSVVVVGRRSYNPDNPRIENIKSDFSDLLSLSLPKDSVWFCCLGTTIKKAGSKQRFKEVDRDMVVSFAEAAYKNNAKSFHMVSALGASTESSIFYSRVKGEAEERVLSLGLASTYIYRPSFILGDRSEFRLGEEIGKVLIKVLEPLMQGRLRKYRGIHARDIAIGMMQSASNAEKGVHVMDSHEILVTK